MRVSRGGVKYRRRHACICCVQLCISGVGTYLAWYIHDLAQYRALERTQSKVQLMVELLGYREIVSTE